jgi:adenylate cyclase
MEAAAAKEVTRSEIRRGQVLLALLLTLLALVFLLVAIGEDDRADFALRAAVGATFLAVFAIYEGFVLVLLRRWRAEGRSSGRRFRYLNTFIEVSFAPAVIFFTGVIGPLGLQTLHSPMPLLAFIPIALSALYLDFWLCAFAGIVAGAEIFALSVIGGRTMVVPEGWEILASPSTYSVKAALFVLAGLSAGFVARHARRQMVAATRSVAERDRAVSMFGQHVSPQIADLLLSQPTEFEAVEREACIMFLDIRDFSRIAGERTPAEVVEYLNTLFGELIHSVNEHGGIVNKFLGDGFMAVFGAPVHDAGASHRAVETSLEMLDIIEELNEAGSIPQTRVGIGLHTGEVVTGNVGSSERKEYTIIGDAVNLASRIEQATKQFGALLLVSEAVMDRLDDATYPAEDLGEVELKGQSYPARLYQLA